jgi:hypothetical protein
MPLASAQDVFTEAGNRLGDVVAAVPDGETGERLAFVLWLVDRWRDKDGLVVVNELEYIDPVTGSTRGVPFFALKDGVRAEDVEWGPFGYADVALESYAAFSAAKRDGKLPHSVRFQVSLPTPMGMALMFGADRDRVLPELEQEMARDVAKLVEAIPHGELAIQWDAPGEIMAIERMRVAAAAGDPASGPEILPTSLATSSIARLTAPIPDTVVLGVHLCYGDPDGHHVIEPIDAAVMVEFANSLFELVERRIDYVHMPVPIERDDDAFFAPLDSLELPAGTTLYLGLVHLEDRLAGAVRRMRAASNHVQSFGVAAECGLGRGECAQDIPALLDLHREIARASA